MSRIKNERHCKFIRSLRCLICGDNTTTECAHIRYSDRRAGKPVTGLGIRPDDAFTVPLCGNHHRQQHEVGERDWWRANGIDPIFIALALYRVSGDHETGEQIVQCATLTRI